LIVDIVLEVDAVTDVDVLARHGLVSFESPVRGEATSYWAIETARNGWDFGAGMANGKHGKVGVATAQLYCSRRQSLAY
jgi:hypothetical protein